MSTKNFVSYGDAETLFTDYANEIKKRLISVTSMPSNPINNQMVLYEGQSTDLFKNGHVYKASIVQKSLWKQVTRLSPAKYCWSEGRNSWSVNDTLYTDDGNYYGYITYVDLSGIPCFKTSVDGNKLFESVDSQTSPIVKNIIQWTDVTPGTRYYLHEISFNLKSMKEIIDENDVHDALRNNNTAMAIGIHRTSVNGDWEEWIVDGEDVTGGDGLIADLKNGNLSYTQDLDIGRISFTVLSPVSSQITSLWALLTYCVNKKIMPGINELPYSYAGDRRKKGDFEGFTSNSITSNTMIVIHYKQEISGSVNDYVKKFMPSIEESYKDEEGILMLWDNQIKDWTDTVTEWTA